MTSHNPSLRCQPLSRSRRLAQVVGVGLQLAALAPMGSLAGPPQHLPLIAQWCLLNPQTTCIDLEMARTAQQQMWGLQQRDKLPPLRGMWFPYAVPTPVQFWMHLTPEPLDMLFISQQQVVAVVAGAKPCMQLPCPSYGPGQPVDGVIELAAGEAARLGIGVGTPVVITPMPGPPPTSERSGPTPD